MQVMDFLTQKRVPYQVCSHRPVFTAQQMAAEEHVPGMNVAKTVVVRADGTYYMCVLPACCKVDLETLAEALKAKELHLASEQELGQLFPDCEVGAEPPFGELYGLQTLMDDSLGQDGYVVCPAGTHGQAVRLKLKDYQAMAHPRVLHFSYHLH